MAVSALLGPESFAATFRFSCLNCHMAVLAPDQLVHSQRDGLCVSLKMHPVSQMLADVGSTCPKASDLPFAPVAGMQVARLPQRTPRQHQPCGICVCAASGGKTFRCAGIGVINGVAAGGG